MSVQERLRELEARVTALEAVPNATHLTSKSSCKRCGQKQREFVSSIEHPNFGFAGDTIDTYKCANCGLEVKENVKNRG